MDTINFKISSNPVEGIGINVKDISPWTGTERKAFGFALFITADSVVTPIYEDYFFDEWTVEMLLSGDVKTEVYGVPIWERDTEYVEGDIVLHFDFVGNTFYKALATSTGNDPKMNPLDWVKMSTLDVSVSLAAFAAAKAGAPTIYCYDMAYESIDEFKISFTKDSCYNYTFDLAGSDVNAYSLRTLEQYNNNTPEIASGEITGDSFVLDLTQYTDADGETYSDGVYVLNFSKGSGDVSVLVEQVVIIELCKIVACYKKIVMETLCNVCDCDSKCTDEQIAMDRNRRDFLNIFLSSFLLVMAALNKDYVTSLSADSRNISPAGELFTVSTVIARLLGIVNDCKICDDE